MRLPYFLHDRWYRDVPNHSLVLERMDVVLNGPKRSRLATWWHETQLRVVLRLT